MTQDKNRLVLLPPDDWHVHFRDDNDTRDYVFHHAKQFKRALVMPNLRPKPVLTAKDARAYQDRLQLIINHLPTRVMQSFQPWMTIQLTDKTTSKMIEAAKKAGVLAAKLYPAGVTTNSSNGVRNINNLVSALEAMESVGMNLCIHAETLTDLVTERETAYLPRVATLAETYPRLRITIEHASTREAVQMTERYENVAASITAHHLEFTLDDVIGDGIRPHNYCKPIAKTYEDRDWLHGAAISGSPKFFLGSDSAPHLISNKECACGAAGVYTAPILMPLLATRFEALGRLDRLEHFTSVNGAAWYNLPRNTGSLVLVRKSWVVTHDSDRVETAMVGKELNWVVEEMTW